jgi:hypothetical protein
VAQIALAWAPAYAGQPISRRLVVSGHGDGDWVSGDDPQHFIRLESILALARAMPVASRQVYSVFLSACQFGWKPHMEVVAQAFTGAQVIVGYTGTASSAPASVAHQQVWESATRDFPASGGTLSKRDFARTSFGERIAVWHRDERGFDGTELRPLPELRTLVQRDLPHFQDCMAGLADAGKPHRGFANDYYQVLQETTNYPQAADLVMRREQALRLRFYDNVSYAFQRQYWQQVNAGTSALGLPAVDFGQLDRRAAVEQIASIRDIAARSRAGKTAAVQEMLRLLDGLDTLSPAVIPFVFIVTERGQAA